MCIRDRIYITGLPSGYEVEHLVRLFYPMAPLTLTPPDEGEDCVWAEKKEDSLYAMVREQGQKAGPVRVLQQVQARLDQGAEMCIRDRSGG